MSIKHNNTANITWNGGVWVDVKIYDINVTDDLTALGLEFKERTYKKIARKNKWLVNSKHRECKLISMMIVMPQGASKTRKTVVNKSEI